jgi:hypothetical protein
MSFYHLIRHKTTLKNPFENFEYFFITKFVKMLSGNLNIRNLLNMDQETTTEWPLVTQTLCWQYYISSAPSTVQTVANCTRLSLHGANSTRYSETLYY